MVNFVENSATPVIDAHNFWNPFINPDTVVVNNATFNTSCPNSILTGPNTGGKSTVIKGIMINVLMAQTFGIAPSQSLTMTPFSKLNCFMNISDDIATGASLFKSEVMRAKKLLDMVQGLKENEFSFVIIDEVFTGTSPQEGEVAALRFAEKLGSYTNNTSIIATHYPKMANLQEKTNGVFHNHHVEILRNDGRGADLRSRSDCDPAGDGPQRPDTPSHGAGIIGSTQPLHALDQALHQRHYRQDGADGCER